MYHCVPINPCLPILVVIDAIGSRPFQPAIFRALFPFLLVCPAPRSIFAHAVPHFTGATLFSTSLNMISAILAGLLGLSLFMLVFLGLFPLSEVVDPLHILQF